MIKTTSTQIQYTYVVIFTWKLFVLLCLNVSHNMVVVVVVVVVVVIVLVVVVVSVVDPS
jgi:hypothetical protein